MPLAQDPTTYIDRKMAEFCQQFIGSLFRIAAENRSIFSSETELYQIPPCVKLASKYLGITSSYEHLDNYAIHMSLNLDHDALKCKLFGITLEEHTHTWYVNLPKISIGSLA